MFNLQTIYSKGFNIVELSNQEKTILARFYPDLGGSIQSLVLEGKMIIDDVAPLAYEDTFASSVLFPFVNRITNGTYEFRGKTYQLECNEKGANNALHGHVYNKTFQLAGSQLDTDTGTLAFKYLHDGKTKGFPFRYSIELVYMVSKGVFRLKVIIKNLDERSFPFTTGWHPYFNSADLFNSSLGFKGSDELSIDPRDSKVQETTTMAIRDKKLDHAFSLFSRKIEFVTPEYRLSIWSRHDTRFFQLFTPKKPNVIAIEPMTGVANSFGNGLGLQILDPGGIYETEWGLNVTETL
ncbi:MAG: aldose 1-epimerase [Bacteroidota bacterium]